MKIIYPGKDIFLSRQVPSLGRNSYANTIMEILSLDLLTLISVIDKRAGLKKLQFLSVVRNVIGLPDEVLIHVNNNNHG